MTSSCCSGLVADTYTGSNRCCLPGVYWSSGLSKCEPAVNCAPLHSILSGQYCCPDITNVNNVWYDDYYTPVINYKS